MVSNKPNNLNKWTKKAELEYWNAHNDSFYTSNILKKYRLFDVDSYFDSNDDDLDSVDLAVDIGGGAFGGALPFFFKAKRHILVDALAKEFRTLGKLVDRIDSITADFANIPLANEEADVVFAWNVFDHANNIAHFNTGMSEATRLVAEGGLLFGSFPMREKPNNNHPVCIKREDVVQHFNGFYKFEIINEFIVGKPHYDDNILFLVARKICE